MSTERRVTCVDKSSHHHEAITYLGGSGWHRTRSQVVQDIEGGSYSYYTEAAGKRAEVKVRTRDGVKYVQTQADGEWNDNLLALGACPK